MTGLSRRIGIVGAGGVAFGTAAFCSQRGHDVWLWSPSGNRTAELQVGGTLISSGALEGEFSVNVADTLKDLACLCDDIVFALPVYAHKVIIDELIHHLETRHMLIFSAHASLEALYVSKRMKSIGVQVPIVAWGTTVGTCRQINLQSVEFGTLRSNIEAAGFPADMARYAMQRCATIFGGIFLDRGDVLSVTLSNLNPQHHLGIGLCNMTRMEKAEHWIQPAYVTTNTGRLLEALDQERLNVGRAFGCNLRDIYGFFAESYQVPRASISEMNAELFRRGKGGPGPKSADNRYVNEDVPFGLAATVAIANTVGIRTPLHAAGIQIFSAMYGRDLAAENDILPEVITPGMIGGELSQLCRDGF